MKTNSQRSAVYSLTLLALLIALLVTQFVAFPCAIIFGRLAAKYDTGRLIKICIVAYTCITIFAIFLAHQWQFWVLAVCVGMFQGGIQALSRSEFGKLCPKEHANEYFGFFDIFGKYAAIMGTFIVGTLNVGTNDAPSDVRLVNEYLNNNPKAEGEDVDPADGRIGEKLIVKNLSVATGSTLRVNGQNVEVGASLSVADGGVIDLDDGEVLSGGKVFTNFYGDGDQSASWSVAAKNVTDLACRGSAFRAVYDSQSNRTYFVCKSTGAGLVVLIR